MAEPTRVLFLPASGEGVGGGHVLRCLALAQALRAAGAVCVFCVESAGARLVERFGEGVEGMPRDRPLAAIAEDVAADAVVVDDYGLAADGEAGLPSARRLLAVIDDLADRPHRADLVIDPGYGRTPADYAPLLPPHARVLAGPRYALLRPAFAQAQPIALRSAVHRAFVSFGLADPGGITARAATALLHALPDVHFDLALGAAAQSLPRLRRMAQAEPRLHLHVEADTAALMAGCDMAVGAGGSSTWERAVLGLPSLSVIVADNQSALARALAAKGAQLTLDAADPDFDAVLARSAVGLAGDMALRRRLAQTSRGLCDGQGARRAAAAMLQAVGARRGS